MRTYIKQGEAKKLKLSEYLLLDKSAFKYHVCDEKVRAPRTKYIMGIIGDVEMDEETYKLFIRQFQCCGGRYDVLTKRETIKGIYDISQKYPFLAADGLDVIWLKYIQDQFEAYALHEALGKYVEIYGETEEALSAYLTHIDEKAKEFDKRFLEDATKLDVYYRDYPYDLIEYLQGVIKRQHIPAEQIISSLPSRELIDKDEKQLKDIISSTRIFFGACYPISYQMIESLATGEGLDRYPEQPKYLINGSRTIDTTFTKPEFLDSIKERLAQAEKPKQKKKDEE